MGRLLLLGLWTALVAMPTGADPFLRRTAAVDAVRKVGPAVVNITTQRVVQGASPFRGFGGLSRDPFFDRFFEDFFEPRGPRTAQNLGSGVVIDAERHVLTNEHVVAQATRIQVSLGDGREFEATLVGADPNHDLAVLRIETEEPIPWVAPGRSDDLMVGEPVIAIGNPFGLSNTVTTGVISALNRSIRTETRVYHGFLQTDASINPGNSGGPLLDSGGRLIGVNTAIYSPSGAYAGIGFAIPVDIVSWAVPDLIAYGEIRRPSVGVRVADAGIARRLGIEGALVLSVVQGGGAARAGVRPTVRDDSGRLALGDVIVAVDGDSVRSSADLVLALERRSVGERVTVTVLREGSPEDLEIVLGVAR